MTLVEATPNVMTMRPDVPSSVGTVMPIYAVIQQYRPLFKIKDQLPQATHSVPI